MIDDGDAERMQCFYLSLDAVSGLSWIRRKRS